jgi:hypothetical protein
MLQSLISGRPESSSLLQTRKGSQPSLLGMQQGRLRRLRSPDHELQSMKGMALSGEGRLRRFICWLRVLAYGLQVVLITLRIDQCMMRVDRNMLHVEKGSQQVMLGKPTAREGRCSGRRSGRLPEEGLLQVGADRLRHRLDSEQVPVKRPPNEAAEADIGRRSPPGGGKSTYAELRLRWSGSSRRCA